MGKGRGMRQAGALVLAALALSGAGTLFTPAPAGATNDPENPHACDLATGRPDDGPLTDPIHHNVEPLFGPGAGGVHQVNCNLEHVEQILLNPERQRGLIDAILGLLGPLGIRR